LNNRRIRAIIQTIAGVIASVEFLLGIANTKSIIEVYHGKLRIRRGNPVG